MRQTPHTTTPSREAPATSLGVIGWLKTNLFSSVANTTLTIVSLLFLLWVIPPLFDWAVVQANFGHGDRSLCEANPQGACWTFVRVRGLQMLFGLYFASEPSQIWRPLLFFVLLGVHFVWILHPRFSKKTLGITSLVLFVPFISYGLLEGSWFDLPQAKTERWGGFLLTIILASFGVVMALPLGILLALGRRSDMPFVRTSCVIFIELWRGTPLITVLFLSSVMLPLFLPGEIDLNKVLRAMVGITMFQSAYTAEAIRGGLQSIPKGQFEAANAMGLGYWQSMGLIILPQALRVSIPGILNSFIELFKDTSLVSIIGLLDLLGMANITARSQEWRGYEVEAYIFAAFLFWIGCYGLSRYGQHLEHTLDTNRRD